LKGGAIRDSFEHDRTRKGGITETTEESAVEKRKLIIYVFKIVLRFIYLFIYYLFNVYEYTVAVFRHTKRRHRIPLQMVASHHLVAGI